MKLVLSNHWNTTLSHGNKFYGVKNCIDGKLRDIMNDYDLYQIKRPELREDPL